MGTSYTTLALIALAGCFHAPPLPPTAGYGAPYRGTGEGIYVKDSRTDWDIHEGRNQISSEQALEAAGDEEYEARRQIAKAHNARLLREAKQHKRRAYYMIGASSAAIVLGFIALSVVAPALQSETSMAAGPGMPERRTYESGFPTTLVASLGGTAMIAGIAGIPYAIYGGFKKPPYHVWRTPDPLNRPAYVRQQTEPYNERIGAPALPDATPAQLKLPGPPARHIPRPRGGR
ncbi:MAG: hypothetical protein HOV81_41705 [Kofleriaceae bacterium]|nr:hypothetical protein [Kofleriaceae bacterium]